MFKSFAILGVKLTLVFTCFALMAQTETQNKADSKEILLSYSDLTSREVLDAASIVAEAIASLGYTVTSDVKREVSYRMKVDVVRSETSKLFLTKDASGGVTGSRVESTPIYKMYYSMLDAAGKKVVLDPAWEKVFINVGRNPAYEIDINIPESSRQDREVITRSITESFRKSLTPALRR